MKLVILFSLLFNSVFSQEENKGNWTYYLSPQKEIYLLAGHSDNGETLVNFFGGREIALKYVSEKYLDPKKRYVKGMPVKFKKDNIFSEQMDYAHKNRGKFAKGLDDPTLYKVKRHEGYNCFHASHKSVLEENVTDWAKKLKNNAQGILVNAAIMGAEEFEEILRDSYENVSSKDAKFGKTIITFGFYHAAVFLGENENGDVFVFTKNGNLIHPYIANIKEFRIDGEGEYPDYPYGMPRNFTTNNMNDNLERTNHDGEKGSGYYNPK